MPIKYEFSSPSNSSNPFRKLLALLTTAALLGLVLMFSAMLLIVIAIVGTIAWAYLWWKTRELRKQMRNFQPREAKRESQTNGAEVFEGEVIRVVGTENKRD
jgi:ABC-type bacteriocin/lantibiotic exporter with double-glycine peptidase domain